MKLTTLLLILLLPTLCLADNRGLVNTEEPYAVIGGLAINNVNVAAKAAGDPTTYSNGIPVGNTEAHAVDVKWEGADAAASFTVVIQKRSKWGEWIAFNPAVSITCAGASGSKSEAVNLPASSEVRFALSSDATYATTVNALTLSKW